MDQSENEIREEIRYERVVPPSMPPTPFTYGIVISCVLVAFAVAIVELAFPRTGPWAVKEFLALSVEGVSFGMLWQLFSYSWFHASWFHQGVISAGVLHILFNMLTLFSLGRIVEAHLGIKKMALVYLGGALFGGLFFIAEMMTRTWLEGPVLGSEPVLVGASAGVCAVASAFAGLFPQHKLMVFPIPFPMKAVYVLSIFFGISVVMMLTSTADFISHSAHIGGLVWGSLMMAWFFGFKGGKGLSLSMHRQEPSTSLPLHISHNLVKEDLRDPNGTNAFQHGPIGSHTAPYQFDGHTPPKTPATNVEMKSDGGRETPVEELTNQELAHEMDRILDLWNLKGKRALAGRDWEILNEGSRRFGKKAPTL